MENVVNLPTETDVREAAVITAVYEGLFYLRGLLKRFQADPSRDQMPFNPTQNVALFALYAESHLGQLLTEFKNQDIEDSGGSTSLRGLDLNALRRAILLYNYDELITPVFEDAVMNDEVVTWEMVINKGTAK